MKEAEGAAAAAASGKCRLPSAATSTADTTSPPTGKPAVRRRESAYVNGQAFARLQGWAAQEHAQTPQ